MTERNDVIVIGAGHNGLVCAGYLARAGLNVVCVDAADSAGGMSAPRTLGGNYHFPGLAHLTYPVASTIWRNLQLDRFGYEPGMAVGTVTLDADGKHLFIDGGGVSGDGLPAADADTYAGFREEYLSFAKAVRPLFNATPPRLKNTDFRDKKSLARLGWNLRFGLGRESMYEFLRVAAINIFDVLNDTFEDERLKGAIAADAVLGNAMGPRTPGTVLTWLQRINSELDGPLSFQCGGRSQLVHALTQSVEDAGVRIQLNSRVQKILIENGKAFGVELESGEMLKAKLVVSNADPRSTMLSLVGAPRLDAMFANRVSQIRGAGVVAKLHLALGGMPEFDGVSRQQLGGRLLVAPSMQYIERAFNRSKYGEYSERPVLDIAIPSLHNNALAPHGHHVMSVNISYVPYALDGGWEGQSRSLAYRVISLLGEYSPNLKSLVVDHEFLTPADIETEFGATQGHWHHGELSMHQSFMLRPVYGAARYDTPIDGLFLCGAGSHPGGGLTGLPGRNAARRVLELGGLK